MIVASVEFAAFVAVAVAVYHLLDARARVWWLLAASYLFYALCAWRFVPVLAVVTVVTWAVAHRIAIADRRRRHWLAAGIVAIIATLASLRHLFRGEPFAGPFVVVGISFYALQAVSYLIDVYSRTVPGPRPLRDVALYLAYFPKLVAGPIERARDFLPRLDRPRAVDDAAFAGALTSIAIGLTRKLVVADPLAALLAPEAFTAPAGLGAGVLVASLARLRLRPLQRLRRLHGHRARRERAFRDRAQLQLRAAVLRPQLQRVLEPLAHEPHVVAPRLRLSTAQPGAAAPPPQSRARL